MVTPAGTECAHYYEDYHRGREVQECRLVRANPASELWQTKDCARCPVPGILRANGNPDMVLTLTIKRGPLGIGQAPGAGSFLPTTQGRNPRAASRLRAVQCRAAGHR